MNSYQKFIFLRSYAKYRPELGRRETWDEAVDRYRDFFLPKVPASLMLAYERAISHVRSLGIMPSMRCFHSAGPALEKENACGYNCWGTAIDKPKRIAEILYLLMCGGGVGYSIESKFISKLPEIPKVITKSKEKVVIADSRLGWAEGFYKVLNGLWSGSDYTVDYSNIRPKGTPLKTFGGTASGPEVLEQLIDYTKKLFSDNKGRKLRSIQLYDLICKIAEVVVAGGVRRSATISLSDLWDTDMANAKMGQFWLENPQRALSNNSAVYEGKPTVPDFMREWTSLMLSRSGERGIVNRNALSAKAVALGRAPGDFIVNPCGEIILRPQQACNLTEVVVKPDDRINDILDKVCCASLLGVLQSTLVDFKFLDKVWSDNCSKERLLGISLTGIMDNLYLKELLVSLSSLRDGATAYSKSFASSLGINPPLSSTCVKPSGTVSQLVGSSSGLHERFSEYYIRRVRVSSDDPLASFMDSNGFPWQPEVGQTVDKHSVKVFEFPIKGVKPKGLSALDQLEIWKQFATNWCHHNPSVTIYVNDGEWLKVANWVYDNFDIVGGLSFLPKDNNVYQLAPYEAITGKVFKEKEEAMPKIDFSTFKETKDATISSRELACSGDKCSLI